MKKNEANGRTSKHKLLQGHSGHLTLTAASLLPAGADGKIMLSKLIARTIPLFCSLSETVAANSTPE